MAMSEAQAPATEKFSQDGGNAHFVWGTSAMQGWRRSMEDAHVAALDVCEDASCGVFAVMDGHGGAQVAR
jgi:serine/threonine protein phosphatase PrpC